MSPTVRICGGEERFFEFEGRADPVFEDIAPGGWPIYRPGLPVWEVRFGVPPGDPRVAIADRSRGRAAKIRILLGTRLYTAQGFARGPEQGEGGVVLAFHGTGALRRWSVPVSLVYRAWRAGSRAADRLGNAIAAAASPVR